MVTQLFLLILGPILIVAIVLKINHIVQWNKLESFFTKLDMMILDHTLRRKLVLVVYVVFLLVLYVLFTMGAGKPVVTGSASQIIVVANPEDWQYLAQTVQNTFERVIYTPQPERFFSVKQTNYEKFKSVRTSRYIIVAGTIHSKGKIGDLIRDEIASQRCGASIASGKKFWMNLNDKWAQGQSVAVLVGASLSKLKDNIEKNGETLYSFFEKKANGDLQRELFTNEIERERVRSVLKKYGWTMNQLSELQIQVEEPEQNFILFSSHIMDRWMFVHWIEGADTSMLHPNWVRQKRDALSKSFLEGQTVEDHYFFTHRTNYLNRPAVVSSGLWARNDIVVGGPFKNYTFFDPKSRRLYMIDGFAFNPGKKKLPLMKRLDVIASTFCTN